MPIVCISGGFSILHYGHIRLIRGAARHGDVVIILNSDEWLHRKYGSVIVPWEQRAEILLNVKGVAAVECVDDADGTVCEALELFKPDYFANGGDRTAENTPEMLLCQKLGIKLLFGVGGEKIESSSNLLRQQLKRYE